MRPAVTEKAPATSNDRCAVSSRDSGTKRTAAAMAARPTGTLTKKIHSHDRRSVSTPPRSRPNAAPPAAIALQTPSAFVRSRVPGNVVMMIESAAGETSAPPRPCSARPAISIPDDWARPLSSDAAENTMTPATNSRLRPSRSAARPPSSRKPPKTSVYALMTHCRFASENASPRWIDGSAMFTIVASRMTMNWARQTIARTSQRFVSVRAAEGIRNSNEADRAVRLRYQKWSEQSVCVRRITILGAAMTSTLAFCATVLVLTAALILVRLHTLPTGLDPLRDAVSDYGATPFHRYYRVMVVMLGAGAACLAVALHRTGDVRTSGLAWLWIFAVSRILIARFMTVRPPRRVTVEAQIHWVLAAAAFISIAFAATTISADLDVGSSFATLIVASAVATLVTRAVAPLRFVFGLMERILYLAFLAWLVVVASSLAS